ncbi:hypothetical protein D3C77_528520 [compost metagenome]
MLGLGNQQDSLASGHRLAQPIVGIAVDRHACPGCANLGAPQLRLDCRQLRPALLHSAIQQGQLAFALRVVKRPLAGRRQLGIGYGDFLAQNIGTAVEGGFIQAEQQRVFLYALIGTHLHALNHTIDG